MTRKKPSRKMPGDGPNLVYRKATGIFPQVGDPSEAEPGDVVLFFDDGKYTTRIVSQICRGSLLTEPFPSQK
jgi:signal peptidase I